MYLILSDKQSIVEAKSCLENPKQLLFLEKSENLLIAERAKYLKKVVWPHIDEECNILFSLSTVKTDHCEVKVTSPDWSLRNVLDAAKEMKKEWRMYNSLIGVNCANSGFQELDLDMSVWSMYSDRDVNKFPKILQVGLLVVNK